MDSASKIEGVVAPRGFHKGTVDDKGRLKLPKVFHEYLNRLGENEVFVTSLDKLTARIYTSSTWAENERFFEKPPEEVAAKARAVAFVARHYGADSEVDSQGRLLVPQVLRQELKIENQPVWLCNDKGVIAMYGESVYKETLAKYMADLPDAVNDLTNKGLVK